MKLFPVVALTVFSAALAAESGALAAGPNTSGGGFAVVCRKPNGQVASAALLDLYEGRVRDQLSYPSASGSIERDYLAAVDHTYTLQGHAGEAIRQKAAIEANLQRFFALVQMTKNGERLPRLNDVGFVPPLPAGCSLEQLAIFYDTKPEVIRIQTEIWNALDSLNQAALVSHELAYHDERAFLERTSETSRAFVARVYASGGVVPVFEGVPASAVQCSAFNEADWVVTNRDPQNGSVSSSSNKLTHFVAYPSMTPQGPGTRLQIAQWAGRTMITKATVDLPGIQFRVRNDFDRRTNSPVAIVTEPGKALHIEVPVRGGQRPDWSVEVYYQTGQPVRLIAKQRGEALADQTLTRCGR